MNNKEKKINRRKFVKQAAKGYVGVHMASTIPAYLLATSSCSTAEASTFHGVCYHDCPDSCSWKVKVRDGKVISFGGNEANPFTAGKLCDKMEKAFDESGSKDLDKSTAWFCQQYGLIDPDVAKKKYSSN